MNRLTEVRFTDGQIDAILRGRSLNEDVRIKGRGFAILKNVVTLEVKKIELINIVTNFGDLYYAQNGAGEAHTVSYHDTGGLRLGTNATAPTKTDIDVGTFLAGSGHTIKAAYPKTNDGDTDNTGAGTDIITWTYEYLTTEGNGVNIAEGAIVSNITTPAAASCLTHFLFAALFTKTTSDTLKVIVNHQMNGV